MLTVWHREALCTAAHPTQPCAAFPCTAAFGDGEAHGKCAAQHNALVRRMDQLEAEAAEDVRLLARLWQLQNKMEFVGSGASYGGAPADVRQWLFSEAICD